MTSLSILKSRDINSLCLAMKSQKPVKYVFFWSHKHPKKNKISAACLSQWYPSPFTVKDQLYLTAEHYLMAEKARFFHDSTAQERVLLAKSPGEAKSIGREVKGFEIDRWAQCRFDIAVTGNEAKFSPNSELSNFLTGTSRRVLAETSPVDRIWGIGLEANDPRVFYPIKWQGLNLLGFALMEVRSRLTAAQQKS